MNRKVTASELKPRRNKFGVRLDAEGKRQRTYNGVLYDSKREAEYAQWLDLQVSAGAIKRWERQVAFPLVVNGVKIARYVADFQVFENDGKHSLVGRLIDVKGMLLPVTKLKLKLVKALFGRDVEIVK